MSHLSISSSVAPFSSCPYFFPASGSLQVSQLFASGGQSNGASVSSLVFPVNQFNSGTQSCLTLCDHMDWSTPGFLSITNSRRFLCRPLLLLLSIFSNIRVFSNESALQNGWSKYWSFSFSISPSSEYSGLISFRIDWFDLAVQGTLKSLLEHRSSKGYIYLSIDKIVCLHWVFSTKSTLCLSAYLVFGSADHIRICTLRFRVVTAS